MLELALLGLLKERPMHGYDLRKRLREDFGPLANVSFGALYPALARLENSGAVRVTAPDASQPMAPMLPLTGSFGGERAAFVARRATTKAAAALGGRGTRARKIYELTSRGEELFEQLLEASDGSSEDARSFSIKLVFARHLTPGARVRLFERRRVHLADRITYATRNLRAPSRALDRYEQALAEHSLFALTSDLDWIDGLLEFERAQLAAGAPGTTTTTPHGVAERLGSASH